MSGEGEAHPFDLKYGTDTGGIIKPAALGVSKERAAHAVRYQTAIVDVYLEILESLPIKHEGFTFVDLGSGKGRALLLASRYPFKAIVGVELSPQLQEIACRNIELYKAVEQRCRAIQSVCGDVTNYDLPQGNIAIYLFNPFDEVVMSSLVNNIEDTFKQHPRDIYIAYLKPVHRDLFDQKTFLHVAKETDRYVIYKAISVGTDPL